MHILLAIVAVILVGTGATIPVQAQSFPDRAIKIVVPYPAGGPTDTVARGSRPKASAMSSAKP